MRLALIGLLLVACSDSSEDECLDCFGYLHLSWTLRAGDGTPRTCQPGDTVAVTMSAAPARYPCADLMARKAYDGGFYDLVVELEGSDGIARARHEETVQIPILGDQLDVPVELVVP